jgi:dolichol-phosphate mannosyltransferase
MSAATRPTVSVILPTYEERDNIGRLISEIRRHVKPLHEIIVVDDDSPDGTWQIVEELAREAPELKLIRRRNVRGLTTAIRTGVEASSGEVIVWMDCDLSMLPEAIPGLLDFVAEGFDGAVGSRFVPGGSDARDVHFHKLLSRIICGFGSTVLQLPVKDCTSGFIAIRREALEGFAWDADYGEYFIALMYWLKTQGRQLVEVPYTLMPRASGESKTATNLLGFAVRGRKYLGAVFKLRFSGDK